MLNDHEVDKDHLRAIATNPLNQREIRTAAWYRLEAVMWYDAYKERGLQITALDREEYARLYEVIVIFNTLKGLR